MRIIFFYIVYSLFGEVIDLCELFFFVLYILCLVKWLIDFWSDFVLYLIFAKSEFLFVYVLYGLVPRVQVADLPVGLGHWVYCPDYSFGIPRFFFYLVLIGLFSVMAVLLAFFWLASSSAWAHGLRYTLPSRRVFRIRILTISFNPDHAVDLSCSKQLKTRC